jgi:hypothetical protein
VKGGKMTIIISVSISESQNTFLKDTKISPSALLRSAINEKMANCDYIPENYKELKRRCEVLAAMNKEKEDFIIKRRLDDEFLEEKINK